MRMLFPTQSRAVVVGPEQDSCALDARASEARDVFAQQAIAIAALGHRVDQSFGCAIDRLLHTRGHVVVSGMGKSGLIGQKIAATFASTGTPSFFVHPADAYHGDLGMITPRDVTLLLSYSGETEETSRLLPHLKAQGIPVIAIVGCMDSTLAREADVALDASVDREACPHNLAPTNSTLAALALGDALAVSLMNERGFEPRDFARFHPGGSLGRRLLGRVRDRMREVSMPSVAMRAPVSEALQAIARGRLGMALVRDGNRVCGSITADRIGELSAADLDAPVVDFVAPLPPTIAHDARLSEADDLMNEWRTDLLLVLDEDGDVCGVLESGS